MAGIGATYTPLRKSSKRSEDAEEAKSALEKLASVAPLQTDLPALKRALTRAESVGVDSPIIKRASAKVIYVQRAQAHILRQRLEKELGELIAPEPMDVDVEELQRAVNDAREYEVPAALVSTAQAKLDEATRAQAKRKAASEAVDVMTGQLKEVLSEDTIEALRVAVNEAVALGVELKAPAKIEAAREEIKAAEVAIKAREGAGENLMLAARKLIIESG